MSNYLFSTLSIIIFLAFLDMVISKTKNGKMVRTITSLIAVSMLVLPIVSIIKGDNNIVKNGYYSEYLSEYLVNLEKKVISTKIKNALKDFEYDVLSVEVDFNNSEDQLIVKKVKILLDESVISENISHIDIVESVEKLLETVVDAQKVEIKIEAY